MKFNFSLLSFILFKSTLNKLSFSIVKYIFFQCFFIFYQTVTLTTHNPTQTHQPRTNSSNPENQERTNTSAQVQTHWIENEPSNFTPQINTNLTTTQIGLNPQYKSAETQPNKSANLPNSEIQNPTQIS